MCKTCEGTGFQWRDGGPLFGAKAGTLADRNPGERVRIGHDDIAIVMAQVPRKHPRTTYIRVLDAFDDTIGEFESVPSSVGVHAIIKSTIADADSGTDEDTIDPMIVAHRRRLGLI